VAALGNGEVAPLVVVLEAEGDVTATLSEDRTVAFAEIHPAGQSTFDGIGTLDQTREALERAAPAGVETHLTGIEALYQESSGEASEGPSVLVEALIGGLGALVILLFTFGTIPAIAMPLVIALAAILNTFTLIWVLTYVTDVSIIVQFLVALIGLGVAIDYALVMIFRYREELQARDRDAALIETMRHAGRSVIVSGSTVAVGLLSLIILPLPFIRSIGIGGMLIPAVSVVAAITLLPALLYPLGHRINSLRVMPKRVIGASNPDHGFWGRWAATVVRRPWPVAALGIVITGALLFYGVQLNPSDAQAKDLPGAGDAHAGLVTLTEAGVSAGVLKPFQVVVEGPSTPAQLGALATRLEAVEGIAGAAVVPAGGVEGLALVEAFSTVDGSAKPTRSTITRLKEEALPAAAGDFGAPPRSPWRATRPRSASSCERSTARSPTSCCSWSC
jgi:RND superfamily putative drug exporter